MNPYQILFPIGWLHAVVGSSYWIFFALGWTPYPGASHAHEMLTGFLLAFATGFLLTAIPRFIGARRCSRLELGVAASIALTGFVLHSAFVALANALFLAVFVLRRFSGGSHSPPPHFVFLPIALGLGLLGSGYLSLHEVGVVEGEHIVAARLFLNMGVMLSLLVGIGTRLITALLGWSEPPQHRAGPVDRDQARPPLLRAPSTRGALWLALLYSASFVAEACGAVFWGRSLRAACVTWVGIRHWKLPLRPASPSKFSFWIRLSAASLVLSLWVQALFPEWGVHAAHLTYVIGFGLMTLIVASRVTLAHGGYSLEPEHRSRIYAWVAALALFAAATRLASPWTAGYVNHLGYAAAAWLASLAAWGWFFIPKILRSARD